MTCFTDFSFSCGRNFTPFLSNKSENLRFLRKTYYINTRKLELSLHNYSNISGVYIAEQSSASFSTDESRLEPYGD